MSPMKCICEEGRFDYARGRSSESNSSGERESSAGSLFNNTRYWKKKQDCYSGIAGNDEQVFPMTSAVSYTNDRHHH